MEAVKEAKKNREWRHEYMTLLMRDQKNIEKGIKQEKIGTVHRMLEIEGITIDEVAMIKEEGNRFINPVKA